MIRKIRLLLAVCLGVALLTLRIWGASSAAASHPDEENAAPKPAGPAAVEATWQPSLR